MIIQARHIKQAETSVRSLVNNSVLVATNVVFPILLIPYMSRILGPENLGVFNWATAVVGYLMIFATIGLPTIGIREIGRFREDSRRINDLVAEIFTIRIVLVSIAYTALFLLCNFVEIFSRHSLVLYILAAQIGFDLIGPNTAM